MNSTDLHPGSISLAKGAIYRMHDGLGRRVEALGGSLWITLDNDRRDIIVNSGEGFSIDRGGDTLISALDDARFVLLDPVAARPQ
jgi:hypothetical protein